MDKVHAKAQGSQPGHMLKPVLGPLTMRDALVVAGGLLVLVGSLVPIPWTKTVSVNMWIFPGLPFQLLVSLLLPLLVAAGFLWRRLTGRTRVRVASLSLDQAGSVVAIFAAAYFFNSYVTSMSAAYLLGLLGALAMMAGTTLATYLGIFRRDFAAGGDSVLGADVRPVAQAAKAPAAPADGSAPEHINAGSTGSTAAGSTGSTSAAGRTGTGSGRTGTPVTGSSEGRKETTSAAAPAAGAVSQAGSADAGARTGATAAKGPVSTGMARDSASASKAELPGDQPAGDSEAARSKASGQAAPAKARDADKAQAAAAGLDPQPAAERALAGGKDKTGDAEPIPASKPAAASKPAPGAKDAPVSGSRPVPGSADGQSAAGDSAAAKPDAGASGPEATSGRNPLPASGDTTGASAAPSGADTDAKATEASHPSTMASPVANADIKATAALSRADIAAHQEAVERAKAEAESTFGATAEVHGVDGHGEEASSFWFALNHSRPVFHPATGAMLSTLNPGAWILCLEDRGSEYLINLADGRPAVLRNLEDLQFPEK